MSVLFYKRPCYTGKPLISLYGSECQRYVERLKKEDAGERGIPRGLSFEDVIENKSLPPCSLEDFMDFLVYIEHDAENLQFYLWFKDYAHRFEMLSEKEKLLSPKWDSETTELPSLSKKNEMKRRTIITDTDILEMNDKVVFNRDCKNTEALTCSSAGAETSPKTSFESGRPGHLSGTDNLQWQPFTIQPLREEANHVMRHYLAFNAPRELNLSHKDRALCLHALQHTTHPSVFLPAVSVVEAALRGQSHPNFIRWSICNGNKPRVFFVRTMGISNTLMGFVIAILLTLSGVSRWWRIFAALLWFMGLTTLISAYKGLCVILHQTHARNLRPWEQMIDTESDENGKSSFASTGDLRMRDNECTRDDNDIHRSDAIEFHSSTTSMQTFGPNNIYDDGSWVKQYNKKSIMRKIFDKTTWTQDENLRLLQDRIVLGAMAWSLIITVPLTMVFVAVPKGNLY